ncbi:MAG TPA: arginase family protein [Stellaceae bacterium]|nr:arginase family protein [Stellaceae bacterium]
MRTSSLTYWGPGRRSSAERIREVVGDAPAYLSFAIDALDPALAPGTDTSEIGGPAPAILCRFAGLRFLGLDVVEGSPCAVAESTALAAATMTWDHIALLAPRD